MFEIKIQVKELEGQVTTMTIIPVGLETATEREKATMWPVYQMAKDFMDFRTSQSGNAASMEAKILTTDQIDAFHNSFLEQQKNKHRGRPNPEPES